MAETMVKSGGLWKSPRAVQGTIRAIDIATIANQVKKKIAPYKHRFDPTELRNVSADIERGIARDTQLGIGSAGLGIGRMGGERAKRLKRKARLGEQIARAKERGELSRPGFGARDVRQLNIGGPGKKQSGPKVN